MNWINTKERYGALSIAMHWAMVVLFVAVYVTADLRGVFPRGSYLRGAMREWHDMLGMLVFALVWLRLLVHLAGTRPADEPGSPAWQNQAARAMHVVLYLFMILLPISGWLMLSAAGKPIPFFGLELPALMGENKPVSKFLEDVHEAVGTAGYALIGVHAVAALYHHYILRDGVLKRMLPPRI